MTNTTILYFTSNREDQVFEEKIRENLVKQAHEIPIISISQKPISLGKNICVGDVGLSYLNLFRQMYIGAKEAKTDFIMYAEGDTLYPPEYFSFVPTDKNVSYRYDNNYVVFDTPKHNMFYKKRVYEGAQIVGTKFFMKNCEEFFVDMPMWFANGKDGVMPIRRREPQHRSPKVYFGGVAPCITFKTGKGISWKAHLERGSEVTSVPYWGTIEEVKKKYLSWT